MDTYEYKVIPAPDRGVKARGVKGAEARFALALEQVMNEMGAERWQYQRAETLPCEERQGLSGKATVYRNLLVFRRVKLDNAEAFEPKLLDPPKEIPVLDAARALAEDTAAPVAGDAAFEDGVAPEAGAEPETDVGAETAPDDSAKS